MISAIPAPATVSTQDTPSVPPGAPVERWMSELGTLLRELETIATSHRQAEGSGDESSETRLARLRLGIAGSLFAALQCKHAATAGHGLRVALTCSAWATQMGLAEHDRDLHRSGRPAPRRRRDRRPRPRPVEARALDGDEAARDDAVRGR